jgi:hypothetical protein
VTASWCLGIDESYDVAKVIRKPDGERRLRKGEISEAAYLRRLHHSLGIRVCGCRRRRRMRSPWGRSQTTAGQG